MRRTPRAGRPAARKVAWSGTLTSVQPRIRLSRSFDQRSHTYQGYVLRVDGTIGEDRREFLVAIGEGAPSGSRRETTASPRISPQTRSDPTGALATSAAKATVTTRVSGTRHARP